MLSGLYPSDVSACTILRCAFSETLLLPFIMRLIVATEIPLAAANCAYVGCVFFPMIAFPMKNICKNYIYLIKLYVILSNKSISKKNIMFL